MTDHSPDNPPPSLRCNPTLEELYHYIDGYLQEPQRSEMASHFHLCNGCDDIYHFHLGLKSMLGMCREDMPPEVRQRVLDSITKLF